MISFKEYSEQGTYASVKLNAESSQALHNWCMERLGKSVDPSDYHCTVMYSRTPVPEAYNISDPCPIIAKAIGLDVFPTKDGGNCLVLRLESSELDKLYWTCRQLGATYDYPEYKPHVTLCKDYHEEVLPDASDLVLVFDKLEVNPLDDDKKVTNA